MRTTKTHYAKADWLVTSCGTDTTEKPRTKVTQITADVTCLRCPKGLHYPAAEPTADYIAAAITAYIEAGHRGATSTERNGMQAEIVMAMLRADAHLSADAANFRFHGLVAEMRDNGEISAETLARITPAAPTNDAVIRAAVRAERERKANERMAAKIAANDGLPLNVLPAADGLAALEAISDAQDAEPVSSEMIIVGSNLRHWGNDEHAACGSAGIMAVLTGSNAWCTTCKTVRDIEQA